MQIRGGSPSFMQKFKGGPQENMQMYKPICGCASYKSLLLILLLLLLLIIL